MEDFHCFDKSMVCEIYNMVQKRILAVSMSASSLAKSRHKLTRSFQRLSSAGPRSYALGMSFRGGLRALSESSATANWKYVG
jgi:hypothetical protein